jgi:integrase
MSTQKTERRLSVVGKGGRSGWVVLPLRTVSALRAWARVAKATPSDPVFPCRVTRPRRSEPPTRVPLPDTVGHWVREALRTLGLHRPARGAHALRRTFATEFLRQNPKELRRLQVLMRHAQLSTTLLYDYPDPHDFSPALDRLRL